MLSMCINYLDVNLIQEDIKVLESHMNTGFWIQWTNGQIRIGLESGKSLDLAVLFDAISKVPSMENSNYHLTNIGYFLMPNLHR